MSINQKLINYIGTLEKSGSVFMIEMIINGIPKIFKFIGNEEKANETYNFLIKQIKTADVRTV